MPHPSELIPHGGSMCLLDAVLRWDARSVVCRSDSHRRDDNPLRRAGRLSALHLIEYGAQAAAVHGGLLARQQGGSAPPGVIAGLRDCRWLRPCIDDLPAALEIEAERLGGGDGGWIYRFGASCAGRPLAGGRIVIMLRCADAAPRTGTPPSPPKR